MNLIQIQSKHPSVDAPPAPLFYTHIQDLGIFYIPPPPKKSADYQYSCFIESFLPTNATNNRQTNSADLFPMPSVCPY